MTEEVDEATLAMLGAIFRPPRDPSIPHSLVEALRRGLVPNKYVNEARRLLASYPYPRTPKTVKKDRSPNPDPSWDNVVRALEEDR